MPSRLRSTAALLILLLAGCGEESTAEPAEPAVPAEPRDVPRPAHGAAPAACEGRSVDPPQLELLVAEGAEGAPRDTIAAVEALAGAHPSSATARVRLGELLLRTRPPAVERARGWFDRALALHDARCTLGDRDHWAALEGAALARMMGGDYAGARPFLDRSLTRWPDVRATRYNLACVRCQTGDVDGCAEALGAVLAEDAPPGPDFLDGQRRPRAHYVDMARADPDLEPLRRDAARFEALLGR